MTNANAARGAGRPWLLHTRPAAARLPLLACALVCSLACAVAGPGVAEQRRVAFVVGNSGYLHAAALANPRHDAEDLASALKGLGYQVLLGIDLDKRAFDDKLREFAGMLSAADVGTFFYAGHGLQAKGVNYLIPVDAQLQTEQDLYLESVSLDAVLAQMARAHLRIVILDACRNNPFAASLAQNTGTRSIDANRGLAMPTPELNTFVAFATQPGAVAGDGAGRNSPFSGPLKAYIATAGLSITDLMIQIRNEVVTASNGAQVPWDHSALLDKFYFREGSALEPDPTARKLSEAAQAWGWIKNSGDQTILTEFVRRYGDTSLGTEAKLRLQQLGAQQPPSTATQLLPEANLKSISLTPLRPSFDCKTDLKDAEVTVCNNPELAMLDNEMARLYARGLQGRDTTSKSGLASSQRQWVDARNRCGTQAQCLIDEYRARIQELKASASVAQAPAPALRPSFECSAHYLPAEIAVCGHADLARLDVELDQLYTQKAAGLSAARRRELVAEQRQWLAARDTCATDVSCLTTEYRARVHQLKAWK